MWGKIGRVFDFYILCRADNARFLRKSGARIGQGCDILTRSENFGSEPWLIEIGNRVTLAAGVQLITHDGSSRLFRDKLPGSSRFGNRFGPILIHDNSFIATNSIILPGITIGPDSIVGAGSVVSKDVPPGMVYAGVPARPICTLENYVERYKTKMVPIQSDDFASLRRELTLHFWGEER